MKVDYASLIEAVLDELGKEYSRKENHYVCQNPIVDDNKPSFQWFEDSGRGKSWNFSDEGYSSFSAKDICILSGTYPTYIKWALQQLDIPAYVYNDFIHLSNDCLIDICNIKKLNKRKIELFKLTQEPFFISFDSMLKNPSIKTNIHKLKAKKKRTSTEIDIEEITNAYREEYKKGIKYLEKRGLTINEKCAIILVTFNKAFSMVAVCFKYPNGFIKIRFIKGNFRYLSQGSYERLFEARVNFTKKAKVIEGEIDSISILEYTDDDVFSMHNKCSLPTETPQLEFYDEIEFLVDSDKYEESKKSILNQIYNLVDKKTKVIVREKIIGEKKRDFNDLLIEGLLNKKIIETGVIE